MVQSILLTTWMSVVFTKKATFGLVLKYVWLLRNSLNSSGITVLADTERRIKAFNNNIHLKVPQTLAPNLLHGTQNQQLYIAWGTPENPLHNNPLHNSEVEQATLLWRCHPMQHCLKPFFRTPWKEVDRGRTARLTWSSGLVTPCRSCTAPTQVANLVSCWI